MFLYRHLYQSLCELINDDSVEENLCRKIFLNRNISRENIKSFVIMIENELSETWGKILTKHYGEPIDHRTNGMQWKSDMVKFENEEMAIISVTKYHMPKNDNQSKLHVQIWREKHYLLIEYVTSILPKIYDEVLKFQETNQVQMRLTTTANESNDIAKEIMLDIISNVTHNKENGFTCDQCEFATTSKPNLDKHIEEGHDIVKDIKCVQCAFVASDETVMNIHIKNMHQKTKVSDCKQFDYATSPKEHLDQQPKAMHQKIKQFSCNECDYDGSCKDHLEQHIKVMHSKIVMFSCDQCDYAAVSKENLDEHIKNVHRKIIILECEQCNYTTPSKDNLDQQEKSVHQKIKIPE